jgi:hypothetical protein
MRIRFEGLLVLHTNFDNVSKVLAPECDKIGATRFCFPLSKPSDNLSFNDKTNQGLLP